MTAPRVLLVGYYGKANFGDDVLLFVTHQRVKKALPNAHISVIVDGAGGDYITSMLGDVTLLPPGRHGHFDFIIHGGGGVFFDFSTYGFFARTFERAIAFFGYSRFLALEKMLRRWCNKPSTSTRVRLGLGIGVGSFSPGSPALRSKLPILADFTALWLRDAQSSDHLKRFASILCGELIHGSDLAFLTQDWLPNLLPPRAATPRLRLGIILRDWPGTHWDALRDKLTQLAATYDITGFIFDAPADPKCQQLFTPYATKIWHPAHMTIADFAASLAAQDVLLTARAHGAICGACLGVPSVIIAIEPKLEQVHAMLPNASILVPANAPEHWAKAIEIARSISLETIAADVQKNRASSEAALAAIERWLA